MNVEINATAETNDPLRNTSWLFEINRNVFTNDTCYECNYDKQFVGRFVLHFNMFLAFFEKDWRILLMCFLC